VSVTVQTIVFSWSSFLIDASFSTPAMLAADAGSTRLPSTSASAR